MGGSQVLTPSLVASQEDLGPFCGQELPDVCHTQCLGYLRLHPCGLTDMLQSLPNLRLYLLRNFYPQVSIPLNSVYRIGGQSPLEEALSTLDPALSGAITIIWRLDSASWASEEGQPRNVF